MQHPFRNTASCQTGLRPGAKVCSDLRCSFEVHLLNAAKYRRNQVLPARYLMLPDPGHNSRRKKARICQPAPAVVLTTSGPRPDAVEAQS